jgi:TP901 family phage tail tape measure protein
MENLGSIWAEVGLNYAKYDQGIEHIARQNQWIDAETQKAMNRMSDHFDRMGKRMSVAVTAPLMLMARQWFNTFADFQQSMANTQSVMGATAEELVQLTAAARTAGEETVFKASQAADALYYLAQSGMDAAQSIGALDGVLTLATATGSDLAFTSEVIAASLSQFSLEAQDATRVANLFAAANANSLASIDKLAGSMKNAGPVAAGFGYSIEETTAALMGLYNAGFQGEQAGNILKRALAELANPTGDAVNVIDELKLSVSDLHPEMNSLADIIDTLNERGITSTQSLRLFGQIAGPGMNQLLSQGGDSIRTFTEQITGTNKAAEQAAIQLDTLSGDMKILASVYESLAIQMSDNFEPVMRGVVQRVTELLAGIRDLNPETQRLMVTVAGFALAAGPTMLIIGQLLKALPLLMGPAGLIYGGVAAVTALAFAMTGSARDMREFYQQSLETSRATQDQADQLRGLVEEYKALEGKPDKSEEEHRRLETVMNEIITLQPQLAKGYKTIDEAIKANIETLDTYIKTLESQSELQLRLASLEYLRTRNQLELELNELQAERAKTQSLAENRISEANRLANLQVDIERAFMDWEEALELGSDEAIQKAQDEMRRILVDWMPEHVAKDATHGPWGVWAAGLIDASKRANAEVSGLLTDIDKYSTRIAEIIDIQAHAEAVLAELERRARGETLKPGGSSIAEEEEEVVEVVVRSAEEMEKALRAEMALYRARIELVRNMGDEFKSAYGGLENLHEKYIRFLEQNVVDDALSEAFRGNVLAVELGNMRDELEKVMKGPKTKDPDTIVSDQMQVYQAELELLRLGVQQYVDELGSLKDHLQKYYDYLQTQTTDSGLTAMTKLRVQEALKVVKEELDEVTLSAVDRWNKVLDMIGSYGPQADTLREALDGGKIHVDFQDLEKMEQHIKNYYQYLVESEKITLGQHLEVLKYQLRQVSVGTDEWLQLWREVAKVQKDLEKEDKRAYDNEPLRKQLQLFEELKHQNDSVVSSYEQQIKWLQENVLEVEGLVRTTEELMSIENEIFALRMTNYRTLAETENWTLEQQLENLDQYVGAYAQSFDQIQAIAQLRRQLTEKQNEDELRAEQEISYKAQEVKIQRLRNSNRLAEAEIAESLLRLNRELDQHKGNQAMIELAYQSHRERLKAISKKYAEIEARDLADRVADEIKALGDLREADLVETQAWIAERMNLYASMDSGRYAMAELDSFQLRLDKEEERRLEDAQRREEQWQSFLIQSRQISAQTVLEEQIAGIESELELTAAGNERKIELERDLQRAKHNLAKQSLEDQRSLLNAMTIEEEIGLEDRLDIIRRMREGYEELYGDLYRFSTEWQDVRKQEIELERELAQQNAVARIKSIEYNKNDLASLREKYSQLLKLIDATDDHIQQQEYLNELLKTGEEIRETEEATARFFAQIAPEFSNAINQTEEFFRLIEEAPQAFNNMRNSMREMFGDYGDGIAAMYGAMAGYTGGGGGFTGAIAGISGAIAGLTGNPIFAGISAGVSFINQLFDPGPVPQDLQSLKQGIEGLNEALEEFGVSYQATEANLKKERFLGILWQTGWKISNEEAARAGFETGKVMIDSMNQSLSSLGSAMAASIAGEATWQDFEQVLGQQLKRILLEQVLLATEFEAQAKLIAGMMQEFAEDGYSEDEVEKIRRAIRKLVEEGEKAFEEFGGDMLDEWFPTDDTLIQHEIRGVQITRLSGQDRDLFLESLRPLSNLDRLPGLMSEQMFEVFQTFQMAEIGTIQAQELLIQQVLIQQVNVNLNGVTDVRGFVTELVREALSTADGSGW